MSVGLRIKATDCFNQAKQKIKKKGFALFDYQENSVGWMLGKEIVYKQGGILGDVPGAGKTVQAAALMLGNSLRRTLIVVPGYIVHQWLDFLRKIFKTKRIQHFRKGTVINPKARIVVTSYGYVYKRSKKGCSTGFQPTPLHRKKWSRLILDEAHIIRNKYSKTAQGIFSLDAGIKWGLTGTPLQNYAYDFTSLRELFGENFMRRSYMDLGQRLPSLSVEIHKFMFTEKEDDIYDLSQNHSGRGRVFLQRRLCVDSFLISGEELSGEPSYLKGASGHIVKYPYQLSSKMKSLISWLGEHPDEYSVIFTHFRNEQQRACETLKKFGYNVGCIKGGQSKKKRLNILNSFGNARLAKLLLRKICEKEWKTGRIGLPHLVEHKIFEYINSYPSILVIQIRAGSLGLNLQQASRVYFLSGDYNPSSEDQAMARCYRMGQTRPVHVKKMIMLRRMETEQTVEERILSIQKGKRDIYIEALGEKDMQSDHHGKEV
tara:strand:+ start:59 stop:1522 length:1464 start_codon:yes stop_codon:yes gene_type:complete